MKAKVLFLLVVLLLVGVPVASAGSVSGGESLATGTVRWTRNSVCEHPNHPGVFLQYYVSDGCNRELFFYGSLTQGAVGRTIWAEGTRVDAGWCQILDLSSYSLCPSSDPTD